MPRLFLIFLSALLLFSSVGNGLSLDSQGYSVIKTSTPGEAIRLANEHATAIDLLVTDVIMPEMNGKALAEALSALNPQLKCLFMSRYTADAIAHHGVLDDRVHFIQKPFSFPALTMKVREVLDAETHHS